jgi:protein gp37
MGETSKIAWTDGTFNPWQGCTKVSPGCLNCYAEARDIRFTGGAHWGKGKPRLLTGHNTWREPERWNARAAKEGVRKKVFCASLADWLDPEVPIEWLARLLALIDRTPNLDWLLLTKRPELFDARIRAAQGWHFDLGDRNVCGRLWDWVQHKIPPANVWVGTSVEDQTRADERVPELLKIPARVRFLSCEPLLGPVDLTRIRFKEDRSGCAPPSYTKTNALQGRVYSADHKLYWVSAGEGAVVPRIDWVIVGGESGVNARPTNLAWATNLLRQCKVDGVAAFMKQMGRNVFKDSGNETVPRLPILFNDPKGGDPEEWLEEHRVREFPKT